MGHPLRTSVDDLIHGLQSFERELITKELVRQFVDATRLTPEELKPYTFFRDEYYTRNLIYKDDLFELMTICWKPGQKTAIHTHNGQLGWMSVSQGDVAVHNYRYVSCNAPENQNVIGIDCLGGATHIELERLATEHCSQNGGIITVDKLQTIHQIENQDRSPSGCVSLHVYSKPFDSCVAFDLEKHRCYRRTLSYFSQYGRVEVEVNEPARNVGHPVA
jgi:Cysteine dioxygenase type I